MSVHLRNLRIDSKFAIKVEAAPQQGWTSSSREFSCSRWPCDGAIHFHRPHFT
jgi:hypothetical protein